MYSGLNNKLANVPTITGLSNVIADQVVTDTLIVDGNDVSVILNQVPINTANIATLQQITTGQSYASVGDSTTFDNNVTLTAGKTMTATNFSGLASNSSQILVTTNNDATTYYPIFSSTGTGQKSLLIDTTTTPLSYRPDTSLLQMGSFATTNNSSVNALNIGSKNIATIYMKYGSGLNNLTTGDYNVIMGGNIGSQLAGGSNNFALGYNAFNNNVNGCNNCIMGHRSALGLGASGNFNTWYNVAIGDTALTNANDVAESTCIGWGTGGSMLNNNLKCTCIGAGADCANGLSYATAIGANVTVSTSNTVKIGRSADTTIFDGTVTNTITQPAAGDSSTKVPTTAWVQTAIAAGGAPTNMVTTDTTQTITGAKTFNGITILNNDLVLTTPATTLTQTELSYLDGLTSNIQTQINAFPAAGNIVTTNTNQTITGLKNFEGQLELSGAGALNASNITQEFLTAVNYKISHNVNNGNMEFWLNTSAGVSSKLCTMAYPITNVGAMFLYGYTYYSGYAGETILGNTSSTNFNITNGAPSGNIIIECKTPAAVQQTVLILSSGASEGVVDVRGNINLTSRAGGTAATLTNSSSGLLTIQNNTSSGITQIQNKDAGGVTRNSMLLQTTKQTIGGDGTDFNVVLTGNATVLTNKTMRLFSSGTNQYIDCGTGYTTGSTPLVFRNGAGTIARAVINDLGIDMTSCPTCIYGRNDNYDFTLQPAGATTYQVGYTAQYNETAVTFTSGTAFNYTTVLPQLTNGVWQVNGTLTVNLGTGSFAGSPYIKIAMVAATGSSFYPSVGNGARILMPATAATPAIIPFTSTVIVKSASAVRAAIQGQIVMTVGTATKSLNVVFVKIA